MPAIVMKDGKILARDGKVFAADVAPGATPPEGCCCGEEECTTPCCVDLDAAPASVSVKYTPDSSVPASIRPTGPLTVTASRDVNPGTYRGQVGYVSADGTSRVAWLTCSYNPGMPASSQYTLRIGGNGAGPSGMEVQSNFSMCPEGQMHLPNGDWTANQFGGYRFSSGNACCSGCPCSPVSISGFFGTLTLEEYDPENDCCEYTHAYEDEYGTAADILYNDGELRYELAITDNQADHYIMWDGYVYNDGGTITAVCEYVAGAFAPDWDWQTLACGDYPVTITAAAGCDCWVCCAPYDLANLPQTITLTVIVRDGYCDWSGDAPVWVGEGFRTLSIPLTYGDDGNADGASWYYQGNYPCDAQAVLTVYRGGWRIFVYSCPSGDNCMGGQWDSGELVSDLYLAQETSEVCMPPPGVALDDCATFMDSYPMCELPNFDDAHGWRVDY